MRHYAGPEACEAWRSGGDPTAEATLQPLDVECPACRNKLAVKLYPSSLEELASVESRPLYFTASIPMLNPRQTPPSAWTLLLMEPDGYVTFCPSCTPPTIQVPCASPATVADLRRGDLAALFSDCSALQRIRYATPHQSWGVRVEWDNGPGSRVWVRFMPKGNPVQIADRTAGN